MSEAKRSTTAKLLITVKPVDTHPPEIVLSSKEGFVNEMSPVGEEVLDAHDKPLLVQVVDPDFVSRFFKQKSILNYIYKNCVFRI